MACYLIHILCHATGVMSFVILLPSYLNASHGATTAGNGEKESEMRLHTGKGQGRERVTDQKRIKEDRAGHLTLHLPLLKYCDQEKGKEKNKRKKNKDWNKRKKPIRVVKMSQLIAPCLFSQSVHLPWCSSASENSSQESWVASWTSVARRRWLLSSSTNSYSHSFHLFSSLVANN